LLPSSEQSQCYQSTQFHVTTSCRCTGRLLLGPMRKTKGFVAQFRTITMSSLQNLLKLLKKFQ
jgi:hypothetical protein